jgi:microcompartment protein CcmL/EutN
LSVTVIVNQGSPAGSGGGGNRRQLTRGISSAGPRVMSSKIVATPYDQIQAVILPGALELLPSNMQSSVPASLANAHGPLTRKLAVATVGLVTESATDAVPPS